MLVWLLNGNFIYHTDKEKKRNSNSACYHSIIRLHGEYCYWAVESQCSDRKLTSVFMVISLYSEFIAKPRKLLAFYSDYYRIKNLAVIPILVYGKEKFHVCINISLCVGLGGVPLCSCFSELLIWTSDASIPASLVYILLDITSRERIIWQAVWISLTQFGCIRFSWRFLAWAGKHNANCQPPFELLAMVTIFWKTEVYIFIHRIYIWLSQPRMGAAGALGWCYYTFICFFH